MFHLYTHIAAASLGGTCNHPQVAGPLDEGKSWASWNYLAEVLLGHFAPRWHAAFNHPGHRDPVYVKMNNM